LAQKTAELALQKQKKEKEGREGGKEGGKGDKVTDREGGRKGGKEGVAGGIEELRKLPLREVQKRLRVFGQPITYVVQGRKGVKSGRTEGGRDGVREGGREG